MTTENIMITGFGSICTLIGLLYKNLLSRIERTQSKEVCNVTTNAIKAEIKNGFNNIEKLMAQDHEATCRELKRLSDWNESICKKLEEAQAKE